MSDRTRYGESDEVAKEGKTGFSVLTEWDETPNPRRKVFVANP
jgi:hypothetical protein